MFETAPSKTCTAEKLEASELRGMRRVKSTLCLASERRVPPACGNSLLPQKAS